MREIFKEDIDFLHNSVKSATKLVSNLNDGILK